MTEEIWKDVIGFEDRYSVSNEGRVFSKVKNKLLNLSENQGGYLFFMAKKNGETKNLLVHRQVAICFLAEPSQELSEICKQSHHGLVLVNHIDGNKTENSVYNLEWTDGFGNMQHASENGLLSTLKGTEAAQSKIKDFNIVLSIRDEYIPRSKEYGATALARKYGVSRSVINGIILNKTYLES